MNGVLNPVIALKIDENHYQLISGHRRKRACMLLGIDRIPLIGREMTKEEQKEFNEAVQHINEEMPKTDTFFQELPSDVKDVPPKEEKPKRTRKASPKKASAKKVKKEITEEIKSETNDENTVTD